jgi:hypothetical protein
VGREGEERDRESGERGAERDRESDMGTPVSAIDTHPTSTTVHHCHSSGGKHGARSR